METFLRDQAEFEIIQYTNDSAEAREDTLAIAEMAAESFGWRTEPYHVVGNNCEHFTAFCRLGKISSRQASKRCCDAEDGRG